MSNEQSALINTLVASVRRRLLYASMVMGGTRGLLAGSIIALLFAILRPYLFTGAEWTWALLPIAAGVLGGLFFGGGIARSQTAAARLIDEHYNLKDRSITTMEFLGVMDRSPSELSAAKRLQIEEATDRIRQANIDAVQCVPIQTMNRPLKWSAGLVAIAALSMVLIGNGVQEVQAKSVLPLATEQSLELRETMLPELEELAKEQDDPRIEKLVEELKEKLNEMEQEAIDESDLMASLSEMEQALAEAREALSLEWTDATMKSLASAIKPSDEMQAAAAAMESEEYEEASKELESIDPSEIGDKQRRAVSDNLKKMLAKMDPGKMGTLGDSILEFAEGLEDKNVGDCKKCLSKLASECKKQGQCKKIGKCMASQLNRLSQCKGQCRGQCQSNVAKKSNSPSTKAGMAASGQPFGQDPTQLDGNRVKEQLTGMQGEGPSEREIVQSPESEQDASRAFKGKYEDFRRQAEAVLNSEPLPMGHRETVRTYFEAIRPSNEEAGAVVNE